ncbi:MAG: phosphatase PAP2 family protein [Bacteroidota bacterium]
MIAKTLFSRYTGLIFLIALLLSPSLFAQKVYQTSWLGDGITVGASLATLGFSRYINTKVTKVTAEEIARLNRDNIFAIDRPAAFNYRVRAQKHSDILLSSSFFLPLGMLIGNKSRDEFGAVGLMAFETLLINTVFTSLTKGTVKRIRPYVYNPDVPLNIKTTHSDARRSFFSGHTSTTACLSFLSAQLYADFYPNSDARTYIWSAAAVIPAATGFLRVRGGKHFFTDVLTGYAVGALVGIIVPRLHRR